MAKRESRIESLNAKIGRELKEKEQKTATKNKTEDVLEKYMKYLEKKNVFKIMFDAGSPDGTLSTYEEGVLIVLPGDSVGKVKKNINEYSISHMLTLEFIVRVSAVDLENKKVICAVDASSSKESVNAAINKEIAKALSVNKRPVVWGRITSVSANRAFVSILNRGVKGIIDTSHWQKSYTRSLLGMCKEGDFFQFEVIRPARKIEGKPEGWMLSRRNLTKDVWETIDFSTIQQGGTIVVKCIERPVGKSYWWGVSDRTPGIELMGDYTVRFQGGERLIEGISYLCKIKEITLADGNGTRNCFKVIPFEVADGAEKLAKFAEQRRKDIEV